MRAFVLALCLVSSSLVANPKVSGPWDESGASKNVEDLSFRICYIFQGDGNIVADEVRRQIVWNIKESEDILNPTNTQITQYLNQNKNHMLCASGKQYMKEAFDHGRAYDQLFNVLFFDELLTEDEDVWIDINGISLNDKGEPETVLDYMYVRTSDPTHSDQKRNEIQSLIDTFEEYLNGKRFHQLPAEVQQAWLDYAKTQANKH